MHSTDAGLRKSLMFGPRLTTSQVLLGMEPDGEFLRATDKGTTLTATPPRPPPPPTRSPPPAEQRANDMIAGTLEGVRLTAPRISVRPTPFKQRPPGGRRWRGTATKANSIVWRKNTLTGPTPRLCRVLEKRKPLSKQVIGTDGRKKQLFGDEVNIGFLDLRPLTEDLGCARRELEDVRHDTVVPLVTGLEQLLAKPENKLSEHLQLELRAARAYLAELYRDDRSRPHWLPGVCKDIASALAR